MKSIVTTQYSDYTVSVTTQYSEYTVSVTTQHSDSTLQWIHSLSDYTVQWLNATVNSQSQWLLDAVITQYSNHSKYNTLTHNFYINMIKQVSSNHSTLLVCEVPSTC